MIRLSIRTKSLLITVAVMCATIVAIVGMTGYEFQKSYRDALQSRTLAIGTGLKLQLEHLLQFGLRLGELTGFDEQCKDIVKSYKGISSAMVVDRDGRIVFHNDPMQEGRLLTDHAILQALKSDTEQIVLSSGPGEKYYLAILPVTDQANTYVASVVVGFPASLIADKTNQMAAFGLGIGALFLLMGILVLLMAFSKLVTRPLSKLVGNIREIGAAGTVGGRRVNIHGRDEVGILASAFNDMLDRIEERDKQLLEAQGELVRKEKLSVLGQVAGSVGHELRNPLGVMNNAVYFLQTVLTEADETTKEYLGIIKDEIDNADRIVGDLLDSVRTKPPQVQTVSVSDLVEQTLRKCVIPDLVKVVQEISGDLSPVKVDPLQMQQVFRNLIMNAIEAMAEGGTLEIRGTESADKKAVIVGISDTGTGISPENMANLFRPLYTTKARGVGLGLMVVKNLTQVNGGRVAVKSELGKGTTFTVSLPASD